MTESDDETVFYTHHTENEDVFENMRATMVDNREAPLQQNVAYDVTVYHNIYGVDLHPREMTTASSGMAKLMVSLRAEKNVVVTDAEKLVDKSVDERFCSFMLKTFQHSDIVLDGLTEDRLARKITIYIKDPKCTISFFRSTQYGEGMVEVFNASSREVAERLLDEVARIFKLLNYEVYDWRNDDSNRTTFSQGGHAKFIFEREFPLSKMKGLKTWFEGFTRFQGEKNPVHGRDTISHSSRSTDQGARMQNIWNNASGVSQDTPFTMTFHVEGFFNIPDHPVKAKCQVFSNGTILIQPYDSDYIKETVRCVVFWLRWALDNDNVDDRDHEVQARNLRVG